MFTERPLLREPYPPALLEHSRRLLADVAAALRQHPLARPAAELVLRRYPRHAEQIADVSRRLGCDPLDLTLANLSYDLALGQFGCSTMALASAEGPVVARNMDWMMPARIARASCVVPLPSGGLSAGFVSAVGVVTGLSRAGFAVVLNAIETGTLNPEGYPVLLFLRRLVDEAGSFKEAVDVASRTPLAMSALITLAGTRNEQRVCVERSPTEHRQRWARGDAPLLVTNHYRRLGAADSCPRYACLERNAPRLKAPSAEELLALLGHPNVRQDITAQEVLIWPAAGRLRLFVPTDLLSADDHGVDDTSALNKLF
jgi:isopenicillin-N N-acyltransferase like protein